MYICVRHAPIWREAKRAQKSAMPQPTAAAIPRIISIRERSDRLCEPETWKDYRTKAPQARSCRAFSLRGQADPSLFADLSRHRPSQADFAAGTPGDRWPSTLNRENRKTRREIWIYLAWFEEASARSKHRDRRSLSD